MQNAYNKSKNNFYKSSQKHKFPCRDPKTGVPAGARDGQGTVRTAAAPHGPGPCGRGRAPTAPSTPAPPPRPPAPGQPARWLLGVVVFSSSPPQFTSGMESPVPAPWPSAKARRGRALPARPGSFSCDIRMSSSDRKFSSRPRPGPTGKYASHMAGRTSTATTRAPPGSRAATQAPLAAAHAPWRCPCAPGLSQRGAALPPGPSLIAPPAHVSAVPPAAQQPGRSCRPAAPGPGRARCRAAPGGGQASALVSEQPSPGPDAALSCPAGVAPSQRVGGCPPPTAFVAGAGCGRAPACFQIGPRAVPCGPHSPSAFQADLRKRAVSKAYLC